MVRKCDVSLETFYFHLFCVLLLNAHKEMHKNSKFRVKLISFCSFKSYTTKLAIATSLKCPNIDIEVDKTRKHQHI